MSGGVASPWAFAALMNGIFAAQIGIAGGAGDDFGGWADDWVHRHAPRWAGFVRHVAGRRRWRDKTKSSGSEPNKPM
jgi:hypothetical protein